MSDWLSDPAMLSALFSAIAATVSALTLWFTRLKGPDIELVNTLDEKINVIGPGIENFKVDDIAKWFEISRIGLVFTNNGSRSGVITAINASFKPSREFEPFLATFRHNIEWESETSLAPRHGTPISIKEGDNRVIVLKCHVGMDDWNYYWKDPKIPDFHHNSNIRRIVENALAVNKQKLADFLDFLHSGNPFGNVTLFLTCTRRKRWFWMALETKKLAGPIEVVNSFKEDVIKAYEDSLENWDDKCSALEKRLTEVPQVTKIFVDKLGKILEMLSQPIHAHTIYRILNLRECWRVFNSQNEIRKFVMMREKNLMKNLKVVTEKIDDFNKESDATKLSGESSRLADLEKSRRDLKKLAEETLETLSEIKKKIANEVLS